MSEPFDRLEAELAAMRPRALPPALVDRVAADLAEASAAVSPWPDRFLMTAIGFGAIAACVIVAMLMEPGNDAFPSSLPASPAAVAQAAASDPPRAGDYSLAAVARAELDL